MARCVTLLLLVLLLAGCVRPPPPPPSPDPTAALFWQGKDIFYHTIRTKFAGNGLSCSNCHTHDGRIDHALSLGGSASRYPAFHEQYGRSISYEERIAECFKRSVNGTAPALDSPE